MKVIATEIEKIVDGRGAVYRLWHWNVSDDTPYVAQKCYIGDFESIEQAESESMKISILVKFEGKENDPR